jgi:polysaccharide deacetylase 2 family uncharacterized protein YibQ
MVSKKRPAKKKATRKKKKVPFYASNFSKTIYGLALLLTIVISCGVIVRFIITESPQPPKKTAAVKKAKPAPPPAPKKKPEPKPAPVKKTRAVKSDQPPVYEIFPDREVDLPHGPHKNPALKESGGLPQVAIIIDDLGYDPKKAARFISLGPALTFSILPGTPYFKTCVRKARDREREVILHLPMEPNEYPAVDPGPGALLMSMSPDHMLRQLNGHLDALGYVKGVNNHMGSRLTADADRMNQIFTVLKKRRLYFVDSRTSTGSQAYSAARKFKVPFAQRDVFLDHVQEDQFITNQLQLLVRVARRDGSAIGIGHPYRITYDVLKKELPALQRQVRIVPASHLVFIPQYS